MFCIDSSFLGVEPLVRHFVLWPLSLSFFAALYNFGPSPAAKSPFSCSISLGVAQSLLRSQIVGSTLVVVSFILRYGYLAISLLAYSNSSWYRRRMPIVRGRTRLTY